MPPRYSEEQAREAIAASRSWTEAVRRLGMCSTGGGYVVLKKYAGIWQIPVDHFDSRAASLAGLQRTWKSATPLEELLVEGRFTQSARLKERLYAAGLKQPRCELCGQGEEWRGRRMSLILDHANGVRDDNRLENLRIVCPNCNATLDTHCGRNAAFVGERDCLLCGARFRPKHSRQRYCSRPCGTRAKKPGRPRPHLRRAERPPFHQLRAEIAAMGYEAVGRKYGVSGNAIRKWRLVYEREAAAAARAADGPEAVGGQAADASASTTRSMRTRPA